MVFAEWTTALVVEALTFQILLAECAVEALAVVIVVQGLDPSIARFHWEAAREAFGREELVPVGFTISLALFQEERSVAEQFAAVSASKAFRMEVLTDGIQAITLDFSAAAAASGS